MFLTAFVTSNTQYQVDANDTERGCLAVWFFSVSKVFSSNIDSYLQCSQLDWFYCYCPWQQEPCKSCKVSKYIIAFISMECFSLLSLPPILNTRLMLMILSVFPSSLNMATSTFRILLSFNSGESRKRYLECSDHLSINIPLHLFKEIERNLLLSTFFFQMLQ